MDMPSQDERRAKIIAEDWAIMKAPSYNHEDFERRWKKFLAEKERIVTGSIVTEFIARWETL